MLTVARIALGWMAALALGWAGLAASASGAEIQIVVPTRVIYPQDIISESMVTLERRSIQEGAEGSVFRDPQEVVGKEALRTLVAGTAIHVGEIADAKVVRQGASVDIRFVAKGISIVANGVALQPGAVGNVIRARNLDSGLIVTGTVVSAAAVEVRRE